jgi:hypothetical protein
VLSHYCYCCIFSFSLSLNRAMLTDAPPRKANRAGFLESDRIKALDLPQHRRLPAIAKSIESAMKSGKSADVRRACAEFLVIASEFYEVPACGVRVLAARPLRVREQWTTELFGDYSPETMLIRLWMRTAVRKAITSFGTFLSTLCHEFCHHLDFQKFGFKDSWHTRGFYERAAVLYHHARATPLKKLFWVPMAGGRWRIDWQRTNRGA